MADVSSTSGAEFWGRFTHDPRVPAHAHLRAGDAERQLVLEALGDAFADGRLARDEFDERSGTAMTATRLGELPPLLADLVRSDRPGTALVPVDIEQRAVQRFERERREALWAFLSTSGLCWGIWALVMYGGFPWPAIVTLVTGLNAARVHFQRADIISAERRKLERRARKQLGPGPADS